MFHGKSFRGGRFPCGWDRCTLICVSCDMTNHIIDTCKKHNFPPYWKGTSIICVMPHMRKLKIFILDTSAIDYVCYS